MKMYTDYKPDNTNHNKYSGMHIRYHILIITIIFAICLLLNKNSYIIQIFHLKVPIAILLFPIIIMIISAKRAFKQEILEPFTLYETLELLEEKPIYKTLFWVTTLLQGYIYWIILLKPTILLMNTEMLLNICFRLQLPEETIIMISDDIPKMISDTAINYDIITIKKIYSIEEKIHYLYQILEYYLMVFDYMNNDLYILDKDYVRHIIRQLNFNELLKQNTLSDIQKYLLSFLQNVIKLEIFHENYIKQLEDIYSMLYVEQEESLRIKHIMDNFFKMVLFTSISNLYLFYAKALEITSNPTSMATKIFAMKIMSLWIDIIIKLYKNK